MHSAHIYNIRNCIKGPGEYSPEKAAMIWQNALQFTFGMRPPMDKCNDVPGKNISSLKSVY